MIRYVHPGSESGFLLIPDPGVKKAPDPGSGSATLLVRVQCSPLREFRDAGVEAKVWWYKVGPDVKQPWAELKEGFLNSYVEKNVWTLGIEHYGIDQSGLPYYQLNK
jgi:hypothetical protein